MLKHLYNKIFGKKQMPPLTKKQLLNAKPIRNSELKWEADAEGKVCLKIKRRESRFGMFFNKIMQLPDEHIVELEPVGAHVWQLCDGKHTVEGIIKSLCQTFKLHRIEAEVSLESFLQLLTQRRFILFYINKK